MVNPSPEHRALVNGLDLAIKRAIVDTYRTQRKSGCSDGVARHAAVVALEKRIPDIPYPYIDLSVMVGIIIDTATNDFDDGT